MIPKRLEQLRELMKQRGMDAYLIPTADFHESEYVGDYFKCRQFLTGFTGSAGTLLVTAQEACLWVDGRYFVQAAQELKGTGIQMMKMGTPGTPSLEVYIKSVIPEHGVLGFDGRVVSGRLGKSFGSLLMEKRGSVSSQEDLAGMLWEDRPKLPKEAVWILDTKYTGQTSEDKLKQLREDMMQAGAQVHLITVLDDIAWLLNLRGADIPCNPVFLSYMIITLKDATLYVDQDKISGPVRDYLQELQVRVEDYDHVYQAVGALSNQSIMMESDKVNYRLCTLLNSSNTHIDCMNPCSLRKARKNSVEIENMRRAHIKDGVAMTRFMYWLKTNIGKAPITEISACRYLEALKREQEGYLEPSFRTISAYGVHGAVCHYSVTSDSDIALEPKGFYLVDSGGQYYEGTTDITRTMVMGDLTDEQRMHFTLTVMGMLRLGSVKFLHGCRGMNLDYVVRGPLWERGLDFNHGTGHGVGFLLNVHERPVGLRWKVVPERNDSAVFEEGMVFSDEPGIYIEGSHGIRTENMVVCQKAEHNEYGQFLRFEYLTFVPIDLDGIDSSVMEPQDIKRLNEYHQAVYHKISPYLNGEEKEWLKTATREIG